MSINIDELGELIEKALFDYNHQVANTAKNSYSSEEKEDITVSVSKDNELYSFDIKGKKEDMSFSIVIDEIKYGEFKPFTYSLSLSQNDIDNITKAVSEGFQREMDKETNEYFHEMERQEVLDNTFEDEQIDGLTYRHFDDGGIVSYYKGKEITEYDPYEQTFRVIADKEHEFCNSKDAEILRGDDLEGFGSATIEDISRAYIKFEENLKNKNKDDKEL